MAGAERASYVMSIVMILEKIDRVLTARHYIYIYICYTLHSDLWTSAGVWNGVADATTLGIDWTTQSIKRGVIYMAGLHHPDLLWVLYLYSGVSAHVCMHAFLVPVLDTCVGPNVRINCRIISIRQTHRPLSYRPQCIRIWNEDHL